MLPQNVHRNEDSKDVPLNELFDYKRGVSCTKTFCNQHKSKFQFWLANNKEPLAFIDTYDYDGVFISLSRNGIAGKVTLLSGKFSINEDRYLLIPLSTNIDLNYVKYIIEPILRQNKKGRAGHDGQNEFTKLSFSILDKVRIPIPIKPDGMYDEAAQKDIAQKYNCYMRLRIILLKKIGSIINTRIEIAG